MKRSEIVLALAAGALTLRPTVSVAQATPVTLRIGASPSESALPLAYAMRAGLFERSGMKIELSKMSSGSAVAAGIAGGSFDIGNSNLLAIILGYARGLPFTMIAPSCVWLPNSEGGLVVNASSPLHTAKDFIGKAIAPGASNGISFLGMRAWMDANGADGSTIKMVEMAPIPALVALEQGRIDGITLINPAFTLAISGGKVRRVANIWSTISPRLLLLCWFASSTWVQRNRALAKRFVHVIAEAGAFVNTHADETLADLVTLTGLERSLLARMHRDLQVPAIVPAEAQPLIDTAAKYKAIDRPFPAAEIISDVALK
jgi:NitT/TauT family transport system substrate-binding protein